MRIFIKLCLIIFLVFSALFSYKYITFDKGISKTSFEDKNVIEALNTLKNIKQVNYYEKTAPTNDYKYKVFIVTSDDAYLLDAKQEHIDAFKTLSLFSYKFKPEKIAPVPFYVEIIIGVIILLIPFRRKRKKAKE